MDIKKIVDYVAELMGEEVKVYHDEAIKDNGVKLQGIVIREENEKLAPIVYIDQFESRLDDGSLTYEEVAEQIVERYKDAMEESERVNSLINGKVVFDPSNVYMQILNAENNKERLDGGVLYDEFLDFVVVYKSVFGKTEDSNMSMLIRKQHLEYFDITEEELKEIAFQNTVEQNFKARTLYSVVKELMLSQMGIDGDDLPYLPDGDNGISDMYVLGVGTMYGAICLYTKSGIRDLAESIQSDLYLLPSSIHEVLVIPKVVADENNMEEQSMKDMVMSVNADVLAEEDFLSDRIYYYSKEKDEVGIVC